jgi:hypothetical protein
MSAHGRSEALIPERRKRGGCLMTAARAAVVAVLSGLLSSASMACGACAEDKVAATYDHAVVRQAAASGDVMVFCEVGGPLDAARLKAVARSVRGVRPRSVRVSAEPAALSFAIEPKFQSPQAAVDLMQRAAAPGTRLTIVRLMPSATR